jgi:hypothetical protein
MRKKGEGGTVEYLNWGISWYHPVADEYKIPKMPGNNPQKALVHLKTQKTVLHRSSVPNTNF